MDCPIFRVTTAVESLWAEIERLRESLRASLEAEGFELGGGHEELDEILSGSRFGYSYTLSGRVQGRRRSSQLMLVFDLSRDAPNLEWRHARQALLTIAYSNDTSPDGRWSLSHLLCTGAGRLADQDMWRGVRFAAEGRFGDFLESFEGAQIHRRPWFFSVPLLCLDGPEALVREVIRPFLNILTGASSPADALMGGAAVTWVTGGSDENLTPESRRRCRR